MHLIVGPTIDEAAALAAARIARACSEAVAARGRACIAISGGETPWPMFERLARESLPWRDIFVTQTDERVTDAHDARRNLLRQRQLLVERGPLPAANLLPLPVDAVDDPEAIEDWLHELGHLAGVPPILDLVQLGLGADGHAASLLPRDPLLDVTDSDLGVSAVYNGLHRMSLTLPAIARARRIVWFVTGAGKQDVLRDLHEGRGDAPSVRIARDAAVIVADAAAAGALRPS